VTHTEETNMLSTRRPYRRLIDDRQVDNYQVFLDYSQHVLDRTTANVRSEFSWHTT
jgi:hypothetical protein